MKRKVISWLLVILWMGLIFYLSHQQAAQSSHLSTGITERIIAIIDRVTIGIEIDLAELNHIVRKNAHFFAYLILGILVINALKSNGIKGYKSFFIALLICIVYAISDEVHQLFVPGRAGQVKDVMIDSAGAIVGVSGYLALEKLKIRLKTRLKKETREVEM